MDDLISRKALWDALKFREGVYGTHSYDGFHYGVTAEVVANAPSVPAVPLDKLCEWLAKNASWYATEIDGDPEEWKSILTEWMEEQDAAD